MNEGYIDGIKINCEIITKTPRNSISRYSKKDSGGGARKRGSDYQKTNSK